MNTQTPPAPAAESKAATTGLLSDLRGAGDAAAAAGTMEPMVGAAARRGPSTQTLVLFLVIAISGASIFLMRKQGMGTVRFDPSVKLDVDTGKFNPEDLKNQKRVLDALALAVAPDTAADMPLRKNPFKMDSGAAGPVGPLAMPADDSAARAEEETRNELAKLNLAGIMQGPVPLARISGKTYRAGDVIDGRFSVAEIRDRAVDLVVDGKTYTLQLADTAAPKGQRPPPRR